MIIENDTNIIESVYSTYKTKSIKKSFDTKITEFSTDGVYDYIPGPSIYVHTPETTGIKYWKSDIIPISWSCKEPQLISKMDIFYNSASQNIKIKSDVNPNISSSFQWSIPLGITTGKNFSILISSSFDNESVEGYGTEFEIDERNITVLPFNIKTIVANKGNVLPIKWTSKGVTKFVKIDVVDSNTLLYMFTLNDKYYIENEYEYYWSVDNISHDTTSNVKIKLSDYEHSNVIGYSNIITLNIPYIQISRTTISTFSPSISISNLNFITYNESKVITPMIEIKNVSFYRYSMKNSDKFIEIKHINFSSYNIAQSRNPNISILRFPTSIYTGEPLEMY
jgi:hypothetical protein